MKKFIAVSKKDDDSKDKVFSILAKDMDAIKEALGDKVNLYEIFPLSDLFCIKISSSKTKARRIK